MRVRTEFVDCKKVRPFVRELVQRTGSWDDAADYIGITRMTVYRILTLRVCEVRKSTAQKILLAVDRRRREDRANGTVNQRLIEARKMQARLEDQMERMAGY